MTLHPSYVWIAVVTAIDDNGSSSLILCPVIKQLFELRVRKNICYFVTVILESLGRIRLFFLILGLGIVAFAPTILHFLRGCPITDCSGQEGARSSKAPIRTISTIFSLSVGAYPLCFYPVSVSLLTGTG
jgi:hypothetical protein